MPTSAFPAIAYGHVAFLKDEIAYSFRDFAVDAKEVADALGLDIEVILALKEGRSKIVSQSLLSNILFECLGGRNGHGSRSGISKKTGSIYARY